MKKYQRTVTLSNGTHYTMVAWAIDDAAAKDAFAYLLDRKEKECSQSRKSPMPATVSAYHPA